MKHSINSIYRNLVGIILTVFYTLKYNWFYILLSVLAPLAIYQMGAGREVISLLFDSPGLFWNTLGLMLALALMSTTIWLIPSLSVYIIAAYARLSAGVAVKDSKLSFFKHLISLYGSSSANPINGGHNQVPARYMGMLPWTMVCATLLQFSVGNENVSGSVLVFLSLNTLLFCLLVFIDGRRAGKRHFYYWALGFAIAAIICLVLECGRCDMNLQAGLTGAEVLCLVSMYVVAMIITFLLLTRGDKMYQRAVAGDINNLGTLLKRNNRTHAVLFIITFGTLIVFTYLALHLALPAVSSLTVLLLCLNFYMLLVDSLFTAQAVMTARLDTLVASGNKAVVVSYKILVGLLFCGSIWLVFFKNTNNYKHKLAANKTMQSDSLESYFEKWRRHKIEFMPDSTKTMNVYLVSGQGGGSRAAVYILAVLHEIEARKDQELYKQTFSISTISGSSAGIGQYISQHKNKDLSDRLKEDTSAMPFSRIKEVYVYNFFNSNLLGLLFYDRIPVCIKNMMYPTKCATYASFNRNYIQEREERMQLINFTQSFLPGDTNSYLFLQSNIQDLYQPQDSFNTPLVFFNTTVMNRGMKGIFSPLCNTRNLFINNMDLLEDDKPVSFHFAELASQSFPLLNNFSRYGENYFGDGGLYENSGTSTTLQLYKRLRKYCDKRKYKVRFVLLNILNASSDKPKNACGLKVVAPPEKEIGDESHIIGLLLGALAKIPFEGHETDARLSVVNEVAVNNLYVTDTTVQDFEFSIQPDEQFALTRVFSPVTLDSFINQAKLDRDLARYTYQRKRWDTIDNPLAVRTTGKEGLAEKIRIYRVYTQYRRDEDREAVKALLGKVKDMVLSLPPIDLVATAKYGNEIRFFHNEDRPLAEALQSRLNTGSGPKFKTLYVDNPVLAGKTPRGQLELWIDTLKP